MNEETVDDINQDLRSILDEGRQLLDEAEIGEKLDELKTEAELLIRKHPLKSVLIGAAVGFILARLARGD